MSSQDERVVTDEVTSGAVWFCSVYYHPDDPNRDATAEPPASAMNTCKPCRRLPYLCEDLPKVYSSSISSACETLCAPRLSETQILGRT